MSSPNSLLVLAALGTLFVGPAHGAIFMTVALMSLGTAVAVVMWAGQQPDRQAVAQGWALLVAAHVLLGMGLDLYESSMFYDKLVHVGAFAWVAATVLPRGPSVVVTALAATGLGAGWELFEFLTDQGGWFVAQRGLDDTMLDLLCDALGATIGATVHREDTRSPPPVRIADDVGEPNPTLACRTSR